MSPIFLLNWLIERLHSNILSHNTQEHNNISPFSVSIIVGNFLATVLYTLPRILWCACAGCAVTGILLWFTFHCWRHAYVTMTSLSNSSSSSIDVDTGRLYLREDNIAIPPTRCWHQRMPALIPMDFSQLRQKNQLRQKVLSDDVLP